MKIEKLNEDDRQKILDYLLPYEKFSVLLFTEVLNNSPSIYVVRGNFGEIHGVFSWWRGSSIHHCLPDVYGKNRSEMEKAFSDFFKEMSVQYLFSIIGEKAGTQMLEKVLFESFFKRPKFKIENKLMENGRYDSKKNLDGMNRQLVFSIAEDEEVEKIFPLQLEYEKEEVAVPGHEVDVEVCYANLENYVEAGAVHLGKINNVTLCKATITAVGRNFVMLGGVYTVPKYRKHGLAKALINHITEAEKAIGHKITLFVKKDNVPALKLYEDCGFKSVCDYQILYYQGVENE